jgi:hypothetical protein
MRQTVSNRFSALHPLVIADRPAPQSAPLPRDAATAIPQYGRHIPESRSIKLCFLFKRIILTSLFGVPIYQWTHAGPCPSSLYGKFTWKLEGFSDVSKRELRSQTFDVGGYKWYILVYPHGCDVANHLSLFLCVADYDKLLPGWSHFAQFTIAVVNKDPKKSKYSDTLHRFCKKEHDWGWKKFMELSKIADGYTVGDALLIKAQVQVILDRPIRPFTTLDAQYRRELVRVYLGNVEGIIRRFIDERRDVLANLLSKPGFVEFWRGLNAHQQATLASTPAPPVLKAMVKRFFNEREVTSTLVMDALQCGAKFLEASGRKAGAWLESGSSEHQEPLAASNVQKHQMEGKDDAAASSASKAGEEATPASSSLEVSLPGVVIDGASDRFIFMGDVVAALERCASETLPRHTPEKPPDGNSLRFTGEAGEATSRESIERDERRLAYLGLRTVELFAAVHIAETSLEVTWVEAETMKRQEELIREEEEAGREEAERAAARSEAERERRARKKERQRAKKEAERAKKEAEEAEKLRIEQEKRAEAERKQREAEERRRKEQAEREALRQKQLEDARQQAEARRQAEVAAKAVARAAAKAAKQEKMAKERDAYQQISSSSAPMVALSTPESAAAAMVGVVASSDGGASEEANSTVTSARSMSSERSAIHHPSSRHATPLVMSHQEDVDVAAAVQHDLAASGPTLSRGDDAEALRAQITALRSHLNDKDALIGSLRTRIAELEGQLMASNLADASPADTEVPQRPVSAASQSRAGSAASERSPDVPVSNGHPEENGLPLQTGRRPAFLGSTNPSEAILATAAMSSSVGGRRSSSAPSVGMARQASAPAVPPGGRTPAAQGPPLPPQPPRPHSSALPASGGMTASTAQYSGTVQTPPRAMAYAKMGVAPAQPPGFSAARATYSAAAGASAAAPSSNGHNNRLGTHGNAVSVGGGGVDEMAAPQGIFVGSGAAGRGHDAGFSGGALPDASGAKQLSGRVGGGGDHHLEGGLVESSGLDDFAHMGLITDLLE